MTDAEWMACDDPAAMLAWHVADGNADTNDASIPHLSDRKLRLFACACCRAVWGGWPCGRCAGQGGHIRVHGEDRAEAANAMSANDYSSGTEDAWRRVTGTSWFPCQDCRGSGRTGGLTDPRSRAAVEVAERSADGLATVEELRAACREADQAQFEVWQPLSGLSRRLDDPGWGAALWARLTSVERPCGILPLGDVRTLGAALTPAAQANLLRDIIGNPFRPVTFDWKSLMLSDPPTRRLPGMAHRIYNERDWDALPILADALEDSGCTDTVLLGHLRGRWSCWGAGALAGKQGPIVHAKGCWALDLVLGKE